ncbi:MAG: 23S rRNA (pseudouridine(1915)-N(3))-methyltransferase RlmH [Trueperaceae bacterium]|nr:23S rRNA (pseudouridine(1915)-N(3))-methyltransferase RlmH [Trueperaceae bacterium]
MRYRIVAVGKTKSPFAKDGAKRYLELLGRLAPADLVEVKESRATEVTRRQAEDGERLLAAADGYVVALDERGTALSSTGLAEAVTRLETSGISRISVLIGGADGHSPALRAEADASWRLSDLTLPHELALLVLLEQLYRAETIRAGHPYHRA